MLVNLISLRLLRAGSQRGLHVPGASLEVLADTLGSIGIILAGVVTAVTGWAYADPVVAAAIGLFVLPRTYQLMRQVVRILMEAAPRGVDVGAAQRGLQALPGVARVAPRSRPCGTCTTIRSS